MRTISEEEIRSLKGATETSYKLGGGVSQFPELTRLNISRLSKCASFQDEYKEDLLPADVVVEADRKAKSPIIIKAMARMLGYRLVPDADCDVVPASVCAEDAHRVLKETMDVSSAIMEAASRGSFDQLDRKRIRKEIREAIRELERVDAAMERGR